MGQMHSNPFNAFLEQHGVKIISDVKTASNEDLETYIEMTKMFIKELRISPKFKASVNDQLLNSLRIINGKPIVKAGPATNYQKLGHWFPSMFGAAPSSASGSERATLNLPIVKKEDNVGWQKNKKDQCFLLALFYYFHHCYPQYIDLTGDVPKVKMDGASEPAQTFMATVPQDLNDRVTLQKFQQILDNMAATPYEDVRIGDSLQFSREKGATKNDEMLHVQNAILEELEFKESDFNLANNKGRLSTCLLVANADLLARLYNGEKIGDPSPYTKRNHMVFW